MAACDDFRRTASERLLAEGTAALRAESGRCCAACDAWLARRALWLDAAAGLERLAPPDALTRRVEAELTGAAEPAAGSASGDREARERPPTDSSPASERHGAAQVASALRALPRRGAPDDLAERLFGAGASVERRDATSPDRVVAHVRGLPHRPAPAVLERLVEEELASPAATTRRFVGDLEPRDTPSLLRERLDRRLARLPRRTLGAAAAALLLALALGLFGGGERPEERADWSFEVVRVESPEALGPVARSLVAALGGAEAGGTRR